MSDGGGALALLTYTSMLRVMQMCSMFICVTEHAWFMNDTGHLFTCCTLSGRRHVCIG